MRALRRRQFAPKRQRRTRGARDGDAPPRTRPGREPPPLAMRAAWGGGGGGRREHERAVVRDAPLPVGPAVGGMASPFQRARAPRSPAAAARRGDGFAAFPCPLLHAIVFARCVGASAPGGGAHRSRVRCTSTRTTPHASRTLRRAGRLRGASRGARASTSPSRAGWTTCHLRRCADRGPSTPSPAAPSASAPPPPSPLPPCPTATRTRRRS